MLPFYDVEMSVSQNLYFLSLLDLDRTISDFWPSNVNRRNLQHFYTWSNLPSDALLFCVCLIFLYASGCQIQGDFKNPMLKGQNLYWLGPSSTVTLLFFHLIPTGHPANEK